MKKLSSLLDSVASQLEARGLRKLASELDVVSNTLDRVAWDDDDEYDRSEEYAEAAFNKAFDEASDVFHKAYTEACSAMDKATEEATKNNTLNGPVPQDVIDLIKKSYQAERDLEEGFYGEHMPGTGLNHTPNPDKVKTFHDLLAHKRALKSYKIREQLLEKKRKEATRHNSLHGQPRSGKPELPF